MANRQIHELTGRSLALTDLIPTQDAAGIAEAGKNTIQDVIDLISTYKVYKALITQSSTSAPTVTVIDNTLSAAIVWTYVSPGSYTGTLTGAFTSNKTFIPNQVQQLPAYDETTRVLLVRTGTDTVSIGTYTAGVATNGLLSDTPIEIQVYL